MDIILKEDIENLGFRDELVSVKPGYARNFLIPHGKAMAATSSTTTTTSTNSLQFLQPTLSAEMLATTTTMSKRRNLHPPRSP